MDISKISMKIKEDLLACFGEALFQSVNLLRQGQLL
jgi:hypothetical protein